MFLLAEPSLWGANTPESTCFYLSHPQPNFCLNTCVKGWFCCPDTCQVLCTHELEGYAVMGWICYPYSDLGLFVKPMAGAANSHPPCFHCVSCEGMVGVKHWLTSNTGDWQPLLAMRPPCILCNDSNYCKSQALIVKSMKVLAELVWLWCGDRKSSSWTLHSDSLSHNMTHESWLMNVGVIWRLWKVSLPNGRTVFYSR